MGLGPKLWDCRHALLQEALALEALSCAMLGTVTLLLLGEELNLSPWSLTFSIVVEGCAQSRLHPAAWPDYLQRLLGLLCEG